MDVSSTAPARRSGMRWVSNAASVARHRLYRPSSDRRKPSYHEWGDIDGPGEMSGTSEFMPIVPFEPERRLQDPNYYYLEKQVQPEESIETEEDVETDANTEVYSWEGTVTPPVAVAERRFTSLSSVSSLSSATLLSSRNSIVEIKERTQAPLYESDIERWMHQRRLSRNETSQYLLDSTRKTNSRLHMPKLRLQKKKQQFNESEEEYERILEAQYRGRESRVF